MTSPNPPASIVSAYLSSGGLLQLEIEYRTHFLNSMQPQHLPPLWSVHHQVCNYALIIGEDNSKDIEKKFTASHPIQRGPSVFSGFLLVIASYFFLFFKGDRLWQLASKQRLSPKIYKMATSGDMDHPSLMS